MEPILQDCNRLSIYPIEYPDIWQHYKLAEGLIWTSEEIKYSEDLKDWEELDSDTREIVKSALGFFAGADMIVNENLACNMMNKVTIPEARCFYGFQIMMENIHAETYSLMIENLIKDRDEKHALLNSMNIPEVADLYRWAATYIQSDSFAENTVAFACFEGIVFSGMFAVIFWIKEKGILPALTFGNELISRDEGLHRDFACLMYSKLEHKLPVETVHNIVKQSTELTVALVRRKVTRLRGLDIDDLCNYIRFVADRLLVALGVDKLYNLSNPLVFMDKISFNGMTNFFEKKVAEYSVGGFEQGDKEIAIDESY